MEDILIEKKKECTLFLQIATAFLLQSESSVIKKCDNSVTECDRYYKVRRLLVRLNRGPRVNFC